MLNLCLFPKITYCWQPATQKYCHHNPYAIGKIPTFYILSRTLCAPTRLFTIILLYSVHQYCRELFIMSGSANVRVFLQLAPVASVLVGNAKVRKTPPGKKKSKNLIKVVKDYYEQTREKPGAAIQTASWLRESVSQPFPPTALRRRHAQTVRDSSSNYIIDYVIVIKNLFNPEGHANPISGLKVTTILLKAWIWPTGGVASGRVCACSLRSRLILVLFLEDLGKARSWSTTLVVSNLVWFS